MTLLILAIFLALLFAVATAVKWRRHAKAAATSADDSGFETGVGPARRAWDIGWDILQKASALLAVAALVLKYAFGIEI